MALKLNIEKLEDVEEAFRPLYAEKDGKFALQVDGIEDTSGLRSALGKERHARSELEKKVKRWEALGKTDEEIADLIAKAEEQQVRDAEGKGEWEKLKLQMNERHAAEIKKREAKEAELLGEIKTRESAIENLLVTSQITRALSEHGGKAYLAKIVRDFIRVEKDDAGNYKLSVVDDKGEPRVGTKGDPLTVDELVSEMRSSDEYASAFRGTGASGSGTQPANGAAGRSGIKRRSEFKSEKERATWVDTYGMAAYNALPV